MKSDKILNIQAFYQHHSASKARKCFIFFSFLYLNPGPKIPISEAEHNKPNPTPVLSFQHLVPSSKHQVFCLFQCFQCLFPLYFQSNSLLVNSTTKGTMPLIFHLSKCFLESLIPELRHFPWMH